MATVLKTDRPETTSPASGMKWIGTRQLRPDGVDKVTGRARFGADISLPGMLLGKVRRSPLPNARLKSIDTSKAEALPGVKAVITRDDFQDLPSEFVPAGEMLVNYRDMVRNVMAREKVLYEGHPVAAVAATSAKVAKQALKLIEVEYEPLPHVIDVVQAMKDDAPILHEDMFTAGVEPQPDKPSNVAKRVEFALGDTDAGFAQADIIVERTFDTKPVHQGYIEPHACLASFSEDGQAELWCTTQGHFIVRGHCAKMLGMDISKLRVTASEIGGGFGGKTVVYLEPLALALSRKAHHPVKMVMTREEVFRATGPTSGANVWVKVGATRDGRITAAEATLKYQAGAFQGSPVQPGAMSAFAPYDLANVKVVGYDVVTNRPKVAAYRAPGAPISEFAVECVMDELAKKLGMDPVEFRLKNAAKEGTHAAYGPKFGPIGLIATLEAIKGHEHYRAPLGPNQGRGVASGFWFNIGGETSASLNLNEDGPVTLMAGTPDIGGSRASMCLMAAEELGIDYDDVRPIIADTSSLGYTFLTGGSRATFSNGVAVKEAAQQVIRQACARAAKIWEVPEDAVKWEDGHARPASSNVGDFAPLSLADIAKMAGKTGGPIAGHAHLNAQGGAVQGIGWALNEEYIYGPDGRLQNPGFLDYRMPVASDVPMIDTVIVEVPNPRHPYGVRGVGETPIVPPMAAIANALENALGIRFTQLPMSPPKVLKAIDAAKANGGT